MLGTKASSPQKAVLLHRSGTRRRQNYNWCSNKTNATGLKFLLNIYSIIKNKYYIPENRSFDKILTKLPTIEWGSVSVMPCQLVHIIRCWEIYQCSLGLTRTSKILTYPFCTYIMKVTAKFQISRINGLGRGGCWVSERMNKDFNFFSIQQGYYSIQKCLEFDSVDIFSYSQIEYKFIQKHKLFALTDYHRGTTAHACEVPLHLQPAWPIASSGGHVLHSSQLLQREALRRAVLAERVHPRHLR